MTAVILHDPERRNAAMRSTTRRRRRDALFRWFCVATASMSVLVLIVLLSAILVQGLRHLARNPVDVAARETLGEGHRSSAGEANAAAEASPRDAASMTGDGLFAALDRDDDGLLESRDVDRHGRVALERAVTRYDADDNGSLDRREFALARNASWFTNNLHVLLTAPPGPDPATAGVSPAVWGTIWVSLVCALFTLPVGVGTAVFLEEFQPRSRNLRRFHAFVQLNISNLAGVPSVVYGIIGITVFVSMFALFGTRRSPALEIGVQHYDQFLTEGDRVVLVPVESAAAAPTVVEPGMQAQTAGGRSVSMNIIGSSDPLPGDPERVAWTLRAETRGGRISDKAWYYLRLPFDRSVLAGGLTLALVVLPIVIIASQEALRAVPDSLRDGAMGLGATRWQTIRRVTLPAAVPGIMTGSIISTSRAIGEAAPLLIISGIVYISAPPQHLMDDFAVLPLQIFHWAGLAQASFHDLAAGGILVLLFVLLSFNAVAVLIRQRMQKPLS